MKKIITISILGVIICSAFNKPKITATDYRDTYTGTYFCKSNCGGLNWSTRSSDFSTDTISISVVKDAADSILLINFNKQT